jgi:transposase InsO family protein
VLYKPGKENKVADALSRIRINILCPIPQKGRQLYLKRGYRNDKLFQSVMNTIHGGGESERFRIENGLLYYQMDEYSAWRLCIPKGKLRDEIIHDNHDAPIAGHPGIDKTYSNIARAYYWEGMGRDIKRHVQYCDACQRTKKSHLPDAGELRPLPIPHRPWSSVAMDLVGPFPMSANNNEMVLVVIDRLTKMAHFIPTVRQYTSKLLAELFLNYVFRYHGLPDTIVSDRDPKFTSQFWQALQKDLGVKLLMSTAAHPQTDGQSEATVKIIQKMLRPFTIQGMDWEELLPSLEFAYNNTVQSTTKQTPFFLNYGIHPTGPTRADTSNIPATEHFVNYILRLHEAARDAIQDAQLVQKRYSERYRSPAPRFKVGDWALLRRKKDALEKLGVIADGPFKVTRVGKNTVTLDFPKNSKAHPTVNISRAMYYFGDHLRKISDVPIDAAEPLYAVDKILAKETREHGKDYYLIHWKNYPSEDDSWEPAENLTPDLVTAWTNLHA